MLPTVGQVSEKKKPSVADASWVRLNPAALEADVAFFEARLELVGEPSTAYEVAQRKAYLALCDSLQEMIDRLRGDSERAG